MLLLKNKSLKNFFDSPSMPLISVFVVLCILFILIRMKGIEQDYRMLELNKVLKKETIHNKELKAYRANLLSVKKLKEFARDNNLQEPDDKHVLVIP